MSRRESILGVAGGQTPPRGAERATRDSYKPPEYSGFEALAAADSATLALVGDTQRTSRLELLWRHQDAEQRALFADLAERRPAGLIHLGDLVTWGSSGRAWRHFDRVHAPLRRLGVPLMPVLGNHDYLPRRRLLERHLTPRFPHLGGRRWYCFRWRGLAFVALDSNLGALGRRAAAAQGLWLRQTLAELDADPSVRAVIGLWHHPPFTNSRVVRPSVAAQRHLVPPLRASAKAVAVFNGHCHAYERFEHASLHFIVSGGGGGPLQRVEHRPRRQRFSDRFTWPWPLRFLNYCLIHGDHDPATLEVRRLIDPTLPLAVVDRVALTRVSE